ncbi:hypothetical protein O3M35_002045 [Rhynocoris fuscipes]|uniref:Uncharacterized protein n=1 Tax=Rhynocoris fuscipes TaxID=488301 RepID=A0AAW1CS64_9HEMI
MDDDKFEFQAPQYWDESFPELESTGERVGDSSFGKEIDKVTAEFALTLEEPKYLIKNEKGTFMGLKTGENCSDRRSSVLCEKFEDNQSCITNHIFSNTFNNLLNSPLKPEEVSPPPRKRNQTPHKKGAYLFTVKSRLKTPKKSGNIMQDIYGIFGEGGTDLEETFPSSYGGLGTVKRENRFTVAQPFSFHERDAEFLRRKKEKFQKAQEEVVRVPEFHARPVPSYVLSYNVNKLNQSSQSQPSSSETSSVKPLKKVQSPGMKVLKAKISKKMRNEVRKQ